MRAEGEHACLAGVCQALPSLDPQKEAPLTVNSARTCHPACRLSTRRRRVDDVVETRRESDSLRPVMVGDELQD